MKSNECKVVMQNTIIEDKFFTPNGFISLATHITSTLSWILEESILKPKRVHIHKNDAEAHGPKLMVIQSHQGP